MIDTDVIVRLLCICFGGGAGALARFGIGELFRIATRLPGWVAILAANLLGSLIIGGAYVGYVEEIHAARLHALATSPSPLLELNASMMMALVATGFCGGLTTFSTFGFDSVVLVHERKYVQAVVNVVFSVVLGMLAVFAGITLFGGLNL